MYRVLDKRYWWALCVGAGVGDTGVESGFVDTAVGGEAEQPGRVAMTCTINKQWLVGTCWIARGSSAFAPWWPREVRWGVLERGSRGENVYTHDWLHYCAAETNTASLTIFQLRNSYTMYLYLGCTVKRVQANIATTNIFKQSVAYMT